MKKLNNDEIAIEIYRRMYKKTIPRANIDKIIKTGEGKKDGWFMKYYMPQEQQYKIIDEVLDEQEINNEYLRKQWHTEITLGSAPCGIKEAWEREKKK